MTGPQIAIIGAGVAGLTAARTIGDRARVTLFDKSRGPSGRASTRRAMPYRFDHGAPWFDARGADFADALAPLLAAGDVARWSPDIDGPVPDGDEAARFVGVPGMNALGKAWAAGLDLHLGTRVTTLERGQGGSTLTCDAGTTLGTFDLVLLAMPAPQAVDLLPETVPMREAITGVGMTGGFSLMLGGDLFADADWDVKLLRDGPVAKIVRENRKPGRDKRARCVVHGAGDWSAARLERDPVHIEGQLLDALRGVDGFSRAAIEHSALHRWRYVSTPDPLGQACLFDEGSAIGVCGDWCLGSRIEDAWTSGRALGQAVSAQV